MYLDIHCHLDMKDFENDLDEVISRCRNNKVKVVVTSGLDPLSNKKSIELCKKYDIVKCSLGVYPYDALINEGHEEFDVDKEVELIRKEVKRNNDVIAIGEIGLDYDFDCDKKLQKEVFVKFLRLAKEFDLPVIIHSRKAEEDVLDVLEEEGMKKVVLHCFSGKKKLIVRGKELGYSFSVPCNIERSQHFQTLVKEVNINQLFTETDAPFLSAVKFERNEPSNVPITIKKIAEIKGFNEEEVMNSIFYNYQRMFL